EARGDIDAVAEQVRAVDDDIAEIDADPENDARLAWGGGLRGRSLGLGGNRAGDRIDDGMKFHDGPVAHELDDAAVILGYERIDYLSAQLPDCGQRGRLVPLDKAGIADDICGKNCREPSLDPNCSHGRPSRKGLSSGRLTRYGSGCSAPGSTTYS